MKSTLALFIIFWSILTVIPILFFILELLVNGRDSLLVQLSEIIMND